MARRVETYPDVQSVKDRVKYLKQFGWKESISVTSRGVYEVEFTRDDSNPHNRELKKYETQLQQAETALDFIDRYQYKRVNKKSFKAFGKLAIIGLIYILVCLVLGAFVCTFIKFGYETDPTIVEKLNLSVNVNGEEVPLDDTWSKTIELKGTEAEKFIPILEFLGIGSVIVINLDFILNLIFGVGIFFGFLAILVIIFIIYRKVKMNSYYKAEVEYIARRNELLQDKAYEIEREIKNITKKVEAV
ncbi:MAG: hypothetical protein IJE45_05365 [Bacilli bacterium]|nr:hypothetical protein [Bacilli bacterium]